MTMDLFGLCVPLAILAVVLLFAFGGCTASEFTAPQMLASLEYGVHDIPQPSTIVFHWTIDDVADSGIGGPIHPGESQGRMVSDCRIPQPHPGDWRIWCSVFLSPETGGIELVRESICEFSIDEGEIIDRRVRFEVRQSDEGQSVVRCAA